MEIKQWQHIFTTVHLLFYVVFNQYKFGYTSWLSSSNNSRLAKKRRQKRCITWAKVNERISNVQFQRLFWMTRRCFNLLYQKIIASVGESQFKPEAYITEFLRGKDQIHDASYLTTAGYISGEIKVAITLHLLGGGDILDLEVISNFQSDHYVRIIQDVLLKWVINKQINFDMNKYLGDEEAMANVSDGFSDRLSGLLKGKMGALDEWVVRIVHPSFRDMI